MQTEPTGPRAGGGPRLDRAIVLQLLRDDCGPEWPRERLLIELGVAMPALEDALGRLQDQGVVRLHDDRISASRAARALDELGLIAI
jgi:hypothetical protein